MPTPLPRPRPVLLNDRLAPSPPSAAAPTASPILALAPAPELQGVVYPDAVPGPSVCEARLGAVTAFAPLPVLVGPGECGARDVVRLDAIMMPDQTRVTMNPPATLRCSMAEAVALWVRNDMGPAAAELSSPLKAIENCDSYDCRGRNRVVGAKISEHGRSNAFDVRAIQLLSGISIEFTNPRVSKDFRDRMRVAACGRFMTVLGPGCDGYHENHIHVDLAERSSGYRMCQWDVRDTAPIPVAEVPQPRRSPTRNRKRANAKTKTAPSRGSAPFVLAGNSVSCPCRCRARRAD